MEQDFVKYFGAAGLIIGLGVAGMKFGVLKVFSIIEKLYTDMQKQHETQLAESNKREDQLMKFLNRKNDTDAKIAITLDNISKEMICLNGRVDKIEKVIEEGRG